MAGRGQTLPTAAEQAAGATGVTEAPAATGSPAVRARPPAVRARPPAVTARAPASRARPAAPVVLVVQRDRQRLLVGIGLWRLVADLGPLGLVRPQQGLGLVVGVGLG